MPLCRPGSPSSRPSTGGAPLKLLGDPAFYEPEVFALDQARGPSTNLLEALNDIIASMRADARLEWISGTWLGFDIASAVPPHAVHFAAVYLPLVLR